MRHDTGDQALAVVSRQRRRALGVEPHVLPQADGPLPLPCRGGVDRATSVFEDAGHVVAVQNRKVGLQAQRRAVLAQHAYTQRMKGANQRLARRLANQFFGALAHLGGGFVGEGDRHNAFGRQTGLNQAPDFVRDDPRFARTGTSHHQTRPVHEVDGFLLGQVQTGGRVRGVGGHGES